MDATRVRETILVAVTLVLASACTEPAVVKWERDLAAAQARWQAAGILDYEMDLVRLCYCVQEHTMPVTVTVRGGEYVSLVYLDSGGVADTTLFRQYLTMDRIFTLLQDVVATEPAAFRAEYNPGLGFPVLVTVDPDRSVIDEEFTIQMLAFRRSTVTGTR